jgi:hypothetical protein
MKKLLLLTACAAAFTVNSFAGIGIAPVVGLNIANLTGDVDGTSTKMGAHLGVMLNFDITEHFSVEPGLLYSMKGAKGENDFKIDLNYLEIPINLVYHFGEAGAGGFMVHAGPYLGYALSGKFGDESDIFQSGGFKKMDYGVNIGAGYQLPMGVFVRAQYGMGLANLSDDFMGSSDVKIKNTCIGITVGYRLGYGK